MRTSLQKMVLIAVVSHGALSLCAHASNPTQKKVYDWGVVAVESGQTGLSLKISFTEGAFGKAETPRLQKSGISGRVSQNSTAQRFGHLLWIALPPRQTLRLHITNSRSSAIDPATIQFPTGYGQSSDSSSIFSVYSQLNSRDLVSLESAIKVEGYDWYRGHTLARLYVTPLFVEGSSTRLAQSIEVTCSFEQNSLGTRQSRDPHFANVVQSMVLNEESVRDNSMSSLQWIDTTGYWISYGQDYLKLAIAADGIYRLYGSDLRNLIPEISTINPSTFQLFCYGREIPFRVETGSDSVLNDQDYIEFPGLRNYANTDYRKKPQPTEEYPSYMNRYTDTSYYWLTWGGTNGTRAKIITLTSVPTDTIRWFTDLVHIEKDNFIQFIGTDLLTQQNPLWLAGDAWFWDFLDVGTPFDVQFQAKNPNPALPAARLFARYASWAGQQVSGPAHVLKLYLNGSGPVGNDSLSPYQIGLMATTVPASDILSGSNQMELRSLPTPSSLNRLVVDWFDVEYGRDLRVDSDSLVFGFRDLLSRDLRVIEIKGFSDSSISVYKVSSTIARFSPISFVENGKYTIRIIDTVGNGDRYMVTVSQKARQPLILGRERFANLRNVQRGADYILLTSRKLQSTAGQYESFVRSSYNVRTTTVFVEDVFDEFGYGFPTPESIREFLKASTNWVAPMPAFVMIAGDANYDFKNVVNNPNLVHRELNIVPALGCPVSDPSLAVFGTTPIPQMYVGRIAVSTEAEFTQYLDRARSYVAARNDDWNKSFLLISGGDPNVPGEGESFHQVNLQIQNSLIQPRPIGGQTALFYKTTNPTSSFGTYTPSQADAIIAQGAICINYIGHSGTQTWDNGIVDPSQLQNQRGRSALITDFGCSTGKFAEPTIKSFSELFTTGTDASAIGYVGNSALGFTSVAQSLPQLFFQALLSDTVTSIGEAHLISKIKRAAAYGGFFNNTGDLNTIMMLTNTLLGDPITRIAIPTAPNVRIDQSAFVNNNVSVTDEDASVNLRIAYANTGRATVDSVNIDVHGVLSQISTDTLITKPLPLFRDTLSLNYPVRDRSGQHLITVTLNPAHILQELDYSDNSTTFPLFVSSTALRPVRPLTGYESPNRELVLLNPLNTVSSGPSSIVLEVDTGNGFSSSLSLTKSAQGIATRFPLNGLFADRSYPWRATLVNSGHPPAQGTLAFTSAQGYRWHPRDTASWAAHTFQRTAMIPGLGVSISQGPMTVKATSGGAVVGRFVSIEINGVDVVANTYDRGHHIAVLDSINLTLLSLATFDVFGFPNQSDSLVAFVQAVPQGQFVVDAICDDGFTNLTAAAYSALKTIGSSQIDSLGFRDSWAIIGRKGAAPGSVPEMHLNQFAGVMAIVDTAVTRGNSRGNIVSPLIGPAGQWNSVTVGSVVPSGATFFYDIIGSRQNGSKDTLRMQLIDSTISLTSIDARTYPYLQLGGFLQANAKLQSPILTDWNVALIPAAELSMNSQTVSVSSDSVLEGVPVAIRGSVYNVGSVRADSVKVRLSLLGAGGLQIVDSVVIGSIVPDSSMAINWNLPTSGRRGLNTVFVEIDPQQRITELYKSNNVMAFPLFVRSDTIRPNLTVSADGSPLYDGDYLSTNPTIIVDVFDNSPLPITDPTSVILTMDNQRVVLGSTPDSLFESRNGPDKVLVTYKPQLQKGEHTFSVQVKDASGNFADTTAHQVTFKVETDAGFRDVYNYPNPFAHETQFTFNLLGSKVPENLHIKIYSIAGRLIQDITVWSSELRVGFNRVPWDGRDREGDELANGVYFYKIAMSVDGKSEEVIQKLAKVR